MNKYLLPILLLCIIVGTSFSQSIEVIDVEDMEELIHGDTDKTRIINFWATWCRPCIEEIPYFESISRDPEYQDVEVILISLDFVEDLYSRVKPFVEIKGITSSVKLLDNVDYNSWIDMVDPAWTGAIPATLVINNKHGLKEFYEKQFEGDELNSILMNFEKKINQINN